MLSFPDDYPSFACVWLPSRPKSAIGTIVGIGELLAAAAWHRSVIEDGTPALLLFSSSPEENAPKTDLHWPFGDASICSH
jgi:hypothetical protein